MILNGTYPLTPRPGIVPLSDGAGEVVAIGDSVTRFAVGDRVTGSYFARRRPARLHTGRYALRICIARRVVGGAVAGPSLLARGRDIHLRRTDCMERADGARRFRSLGNGFWSSAQAASHFSPCSLPSSWAAASRPSPRAARRLGGCGRSAPTS
ncbi:alcohol dehydrogenase catalytic domain-containing protein [Mesorhizobium sp. M1C.F.Ca.ET.187.01.1.1]